MPLASTLYCNPLGSVTTPGRLRVGREKRLALLASDRPPLLGLLLLLAIHALHGDGHQFFVVLRLGFGEAVFQPREQTVGVDFHFIVAKTRADLKTDEVAVVPRIGRRSYGERVGGGGGSVGAGWGYRGESLLGDDPRRGGDEADGNQAGSNRHDGTCSEYGGDERGNAKCEKGKREDGSRRRGRGGRRDGRSVGGASARGIDYAKNDHDD